MRTICLGIHKFFRYYETPIILKRRNKVGKSIVTDKTFPVPIDDLQKMVAVAELGMGISNYGDHLAILEKNANLHGFE